MNFLLSGGTCNSTPLQQRIRCGDELISEDQCILASCCWTENVDQSMRNEQQLNIKLPNCFYPPSGKVET